jgi:hypothetical protein
MTTDEAMRIRVEDLARRVLGIEDELRANRPVLLAQQLQNVDRDVTDLSGEVRGLRRAVIGFAITVAASAVGFALTVILVWGGN